MDFSNAEAFSFDEGTIKTFNPGQIGVFGIYRRDAWVYIGRGDLVAELLRYVRGENPRILAERPTYFCAIVTDDDVALEKELIRQYRPIANERVG